MIGHWADVIPSFRVEDWAGVGTKEMLIVNS
jgi:hypothetical protein